MSGGVEVSLPERKTIQEARRRRAADNKFVRVRDSRAAKKSPNFISARTIQNIALGATHEVRLNDCANEKDHGS